MTLRTRILLTTTLILVVLVALVLVAGQFTIESTAAYSERLETERDVQRVLAAYAEEIAALGTNTSNWATSDDAYAFVADGNAGFIQSNLVHQTFENLRVNGIVFVDSAGKVVYNREYDLERSAPLPDSARLLAAVGTGSPLLQRAMDGQGADGLLMLPEGPLLFVTRPVLTSEGQGPSRGLLLMGRFLDADEIAHFQKVTKLDIAVRRLDQPAVDAGSDTCAPPSPDSLISVCALSEERIAGYTQVNDIFGNPALMLEVSAPRDTYALGQAGRRFFVTALILAGAVLIGVVLWLLESKVLSRLARTSREVGRIGARGDFSQRVSPAGRDELGTLTHSINHMLDALQASQRAVQDRADELEALHATALELNAARQPEQLLDMIVARAVALLKSDGGALYLCEPQREQVRCAVSYKQAHDYRGFTLKYGEGAAGEVAQTGQPLVIDDYRIWSHRAAFFEADESFDAVLGVPLIWQGAARGVIEVLARERRYTQSDVNLLSLLADQAVIAIENARLFAEVQMLAITDELTAIYNRRRTFEVAEHEFQRAQRFERPLSLLMIDVDHFKLVNDRYGHGVGDQVLAGLAALLARHIRELDALGRYGGEEFMLVLPEADQAEAQHIAERLRSVVAATPQRAGQFAIALTVSIGIATRSTASDDLRTLIDAADQALYAAKQAGRNRAYAYGGNEVAVREDDAGDYAVAG